MVQQAKTALVLAGHGSHISSRTAGVVWKHVDRLRVLGVADEVTAAFWKEAPSFHHVFATLTAHDITVIPVFTAQGYFTQTVIPTEMGLTGDITSSGDRTIRYARTPGEHPEMARVVRQRVEKACQELDTSPNQAAVAVIGHSTRRNPDSRKATEHQVALLKKANVAAEVIAVYLDDSPAISDAYELTSSPILICVPYFMAAGSHTTFDIPARLGLLEGQQRAAINGRTVYYTAPVGVEDSLTEVILDLAREVGAPLHALQNKSPWEHFPTAGRAALVEAVQAAGTLRFGELTLTMNSACVVQTDAKIPLHTPDQLRSLVRGDAEHFRPLVTARNLPTGWRVDLSSSLHLHAVAETVYPGVIAAWAAARERTLNVVNLEATGGRQTGMLRTVNKLTKYQQKELIASVCGNCVLQPAWSDGTWSDLPCVEPCNMWLSTAVQQQDYQETLQS